MSNVSTDKRLIRAISEFFKIVTISSVALLIIRCAYPSGSIVDTVLQTNCSSSPLAGYKIISFPTNCG